MVQRARKVMPEFRAETAASARKATLEMLVHLEGLVPRGCLVRLACPVLLGSPGVPGGQAKSAIQDLMVDQATQERKETAVLMGDPAPTANLAIQARKVSLGPLALDNEVAKASPVCPDRRENQANTA